MIYCKDCKYKEGVGWCGSNPDVIDDWKERRLDRVPCAFKNQNNDCDEFEVKKPVVKKPTRLGGVLHKFFK